uniref:Doublecortin domain-containing protein n=2 Tax=Meleagris gallopavo TaxID=9103 RepID=A0A803YJ45_MELGA
MSESLSSSYSMNQPNSSESEQSLSTRHFNVTEPVVAKRICFYKSGDPQFNGIKMVINNRSYKTFDALLDSLSKRVPLPFGVRNISTPKGRHSITSLDDLEDGKSYICSHQRKMKPINLERASRKPLPWQISRPVSARRRAVQLAKENEDGFGRESKITTPKKMLVFKNGDVRLRRTIVLGKKNTQTFEALLDYMSELMQYPVAKLYTTDGRKVRMKMRIDDCFMFLSSLSKSTSLEEIITYKSCNQREASGNILFQVIKRSNFSFSYLSLFQL